MFSLQASVTWFLVGLIWYVQLVHYPLMADFDRRNFAAAHARHSRFTGWIVAPAMGLELVLAIRGAIVFGHYGAFALLVLVWAVTFFVMVPLHGQLAKGFDEAAHARLVRWNWTRTLAWSVRGILVTAL